MYMDGLLRWSFHGSVDHQGCYRCPLCQSWLTPLHSTVCPKIWNKVIFKHNVISRFFFDELRKEYAAGLEVVPTDFQHLRDRIRTPDIQFFDPVGVGSKLVSWDISITTGSVQDREREKVNHYSHAAHGAIGELHPIVFSTLGTPGARAATAIRRYVSLTPVKKILLSVTLQKMNSLAINKWYRQVVGVMWSLPKGNASQQPHTDVVGLTG